MFAVQAPNVSQLQDHTPYSKQYGSLESDQKCKFFKPKMAATAGLNSIDVIWHKKSAEDAYLTKAIDGRFRIQLVQPFRTVTIASAYPR